VFIGKNGPEKSQIVSECKANMDNHVVSKNNNGGSYKKIYALGVCRGGALKKKKHFAWAKQGYTGNNQQLGQTSQKKKTDQITVDSQTATP